MVDGLGRKIRASSEMIARAALGEKHIREETESFARELEEL